MKTKIFLILLAVSMISVVSCTKYPPASDRLIEDLAIYTKYDVGTDFNQFHTFYIVDSIYYKDNKDSGRYLDANAAAVINRVASNMKARGFLQITDTVNTEYDLGIMVFAIKNTNTSVYYPGWYWGYYPPSWWGYPYYPYNYPYYPAYITSYSTGTLWWEMVDRKNAPTTHKLYIRWNAYIRALLTNTHTLGDINSSIDQAFTQTPAIKTTAN
ncbi:MAG: DUF4136 domain-containing protein [Bacteroidales bacterium]|nr:DUF4136 domain-containing protein [Bacteroidales bacterium]